MRVIAENKVAHFVIEARCTTKSTCSEILLALMTMSFA